MTFKFPTSGTTLSVPPIGTTFGVGTKVWSWDGSVFFRSDLGQRGATGSTGTGITNVKIGNDGKLTFNFDDKEGITVDLGDVIKPAGFKYSINVNPGSTGIALIGTQGATSNFLTFNNFDLDGNDTTKFFNTIVENPKNTTLTIRSLVGATQVSLGIDNSSITTGSFRVFQGISGSGFTSPFEIGDTVFLFKEVSGKTGSGITNPELTSDGKLTFDIIDSDGITTSKIDLGVVRGATGSGKINTDPLTDPANELLGSTSDFDPLAFVKNTISFGDLSVADKSATDTNKTIFAVRDFPDTSGFGGGGISGEDVLIQSKRGLKLSRVDLNSGLSVVPAYADFAIRLMGSDTQAGVTIPSGTDIILKGTGYDFRAGGSGDIFTIDHRDTIGVKVLQVPFTVRNLIAGEDGISLGAGISFPDGTHQTAAHAPHEFVESFNGVTGAVVTNALILPCAGISGPSAITFDNGEVIRNSPDGSIQIIPSDEGGNHFGIEIDATEWGFGPVVNVIDESGTQVTKAIRLDTDVVMSQSNVPDGTPATIFFNNASDRGMAQNSNGDGTIGMGPNGHNGHFAVVSKFHLDSSNRSMSASDKTALGMTNPQFLVYSADADDANDYIRLEHDQTDANIFSGNGDIHLIPAGGDVGLSGANLVNLGTIFANTITDDGNGIAINSSGSNDPIAITATSGPLSLKGGAGVRFATDYDDPFVFEAEFSVTPTGNIDFDTSKGQFLDVNSDMHMQIGDLDTVTSNTRVNIDPAHSSGITGIIEMTTDGTVRETFDSTYRRNTDVATFTINASSSIATGAKTNSLYRIPYDATLTNFDVKASAIGGLTAAIRIAGPDFGDPLTSGITGCSLGVEGLTGSSTVFNQASVTAGNFVLLDIFSNNSGSTGTQAFLTFESR